jgi:hypothetical protein
MDGWKLRGIGSVDQPGAGPNSNLQSMPPEPSSPSEETDGGIAIDGDDR